MTDGAVAEPISLGWGERLAAFWSIWWPCWIIVGLNVAFGAVLTSGEFHRSLQVLSVLTQALVFAFQALLVHRLVRKQYRSFYIAVLPDGEPPGRALSTTERIRVWLRTSWPQAAFIVLIYAVSQWMLQHGGREAVQSLTTLAPWTRILAVGPYAIDCAMSAKYKGFRLQAFRRPPRQRHLTRLPDAAGSGGNRAIAFVIFLCE
jgi:hypothetical protein